MREFPRLMQNMPRSWNRSSTIITAIVFYALCGLLLLLWPDSAYLIANYALGILLCGVGLFLSINYFRCSAEDCFLSVSLMTGLFTICIGIFVLAFPGFLKRLLPTIWGISLLAGGFGKVQISLDLLRIKTSNWWIILVVSLLSFALGILAIAKPGDIARTLVMFLGVSLLVEAAVNLGTFIYISSRVRVFNEKRLHGITTEASEPDSTDP